METWLRASNSRGHVEKKEATLLQYVHRTLVWLSLLPAVSGQCIPQDVPVLAFMSIDAYTH